MEYMLDNGKEKAYGPTGDSSNVVASGRGGTRYDCLGGDSLSFMSTLTYVLKSSWASEDSGTQARRYDAALAVLWD